MPKKLKTESDLTAFIACEGKNVVLYVAQWSRASKQFRPHFDKLEKKLEGKFATIDIDDMVINNTECLPTVRVFCRGIMLGEVLGPVIETDDIAAILNGEFKPVDRQVSPCSPDSNAISLERSLSNSSSLSHSRSKNKMLVDMKLKQASSKSLLSVGEADTGVSKFKALKKHASSDSISKRKGMNLFASFRRSDSVPKVLHKVKTKKELDQLVSNCPKLSVMFHHTTDAASVELLRTYTSVAAAHPSITFCIVSLKSLESAQLFFLSSLPYFRTYGNGTVHELNIVKREDLEDSLSQFVHS